MGVFFLCIFDSADHICHNICIDCFHQSIVVCFCDTGINGQAGQNRKIKLLCNLIQMALSLGITPPVRMSGSVAGSPGCTLVGEKGRVTIDHGVIAAQRHIHMTPEDAKAMGVKDKQNVRLQVFTERPVIFEDVAVRVREDFATFVHLDYDEANACGFQNGDLGRILP